MIRANSVAERLMDRSAAHSASTTESSVSAQTPAGKWP